MSRGRTALLVGGLVSAATAATLDVRRLGIETADPQEWSLLLAGVPALALAGVFSFDRRRTSFGHGGPLLASWLAIALVGGLAGPSPLQALLATGVFAVTGVAAAALVRTSGWTPLLIAIAGVAVVHGALGVGLALVDVIEPMTEERRLVLLTYEPNHLARLAALGAVAAVAIGLRTTRSSLHLLAWPIAATCAGAVLLTQSRTGAAAMAAAMAIPVIRASRPRLALTAAAVGMLAVGAIGVAGLAGPVVETLSRTGDRSLADIRTGNGRIELWPAVIDEWASSPVVGVGLGHDFETVSETRRDGRIGWHAEHSHSLVLHVLMVSGAAGFVAFAAAMTDALWSGLRRADPWPLSLLVLIAIDGLSEAVLSTPGPAWLVVAAAVIRLRSGRRLRRQTDGDRLVALAHRASPSR